MYAGVDLIAILVRAIAAGVVVHVGVPAGWVDCGHQVWIQHDGFLTRSVHLATRTFHVHGENASEKGNLGRARA